MSERKKRVKGKRIFLGVMLAVIAVCFAAYFISVLSFNRMDRQFSPGDSSSELKVMIYPRAGITDSWKKVIDLDEDSDNDGINDTAVYYASIYEVRIDNNTGYIISDWSLRLNITEKCWFNSAWCGTIDFYQNILNSMVHQRLDLRDYNVDDIELEYLLFNSDMLIPLDKGNYLIYNPNGEVSEYPVYASRPENGDIKSVTIGFIAYSDTEEVIDFSDFEISYHLKKDIVQDKLFWSLVSALVLWFICLVIFAAVEISVISLQKRNLQNEKIIEQALSVFTRFFEAKDTYTNGHSLRVAEYSGKIARGLGFSDDECRHIYYIALMHDCGKVYIPDAILKKNGRLTDEEYEIIKTHTVKGAEMLEDFSSIDGIKDGALYHHERYDGRGYPTGRKGEEIPLIGRIICVADSFDAMDSKRCYRDRLPNERIISEIENNKGRQFDPDIADCFLRLLEEGVIKFSTEQTGAEEL